MWLSMSLLCVRWQGWGLIRTHMNVPYRYNGLCKSEVNAKSIANAEHNKPWGSPALGSNLLLTSRIRLSRDGEEEGWWSPPRLRLSTSQELPEPCYINKARAGEGVGDRGQGTGSRGQEQEQEQSGTGAAALGEECGGGLFALSSMLRQTV